MQAFNESLPFDRVLWKQDIDGSIAWCRANHKAGILTKGELDIILAGFKDVAQEWISGEFVIKREVDEDIHTANERRLGEIIGTKVAGKLHTGRSRNEQIATDMRLWLRDELFKVETFLEDFLK